MLNAPTIVIVALLYLCLLFAIAYYGDKRADRGQSLIANPYIYALSIAVYATSWTFYGSVGRAASTGVGFLPIYIGPTLTFILAWYLIRKIIRISKVNRITSIADFIASRYGKSSNLGGLVTIVAVVGILPYISLQLKAISISFSVLLGYPDIVMPATSGSTPFLHDTGLYVALIMATFSILFGTRHIDASERHEGMVAAIAFESVVKLLAFLAVGLFVTFGVYQGFGDIFSRAAASTELAKLFTIDSGTGYTTWISLTMLAMVSIVVLPRQFQVLVVENVDERHVKKAIWLFPLYLLLINIFVLPIALAGLLHFPNGGVDADTFVLTLPMAEQQQTIALLAFIGGLSASTGMIIVETVALSTMVCNDLVMPMLLRFGRLHLSERRDLTGVLLAIRRGAIVVVVLLGYGYVRLIGETYALVTIGLVSFVAATQFAPAIIGGVLWKGATKAGALAGLTAGFLVWMYTLLLPSFARSGWISEQFIDNGPLGIALLRPYELLGLSSLDPIAHALFWTMVANVFLYIVVSVVTSQSIIERSQANQFVDIGRATPGERIWRGRATVGDLRRLSARFLGEPLTEAAFDRFSRERDRRLEDASPADADIVPYIERQLAGAIGAASARIMVASVLREEMHDIDEVMQILDEASELVVYSRRLEAKSQELEAATNELRAANERLKELDKLKDDFVTTVSHELRTPLTSIRSFSEIVHDNPDLPIEERSEFLRIIARESERLTRLLNDILDLAKMEAGKTKWHKANIAPRIVIEQALAATKGLLRKHPKVRLETHLDDALPVIHVDPDRLTQVIVNLISNAVKFANQEEGWVQLEAKQEDGALRVNVTDNGIGIAKRDQRKIFERFQQAGNTLTDKPEGTGLGLPISREILKQFDGEIWVESEIGKGATVSFRIPATAARETVTARAKGARALKPV
jgi:Na+/proline symporter/nitrogen-specific signal transduction histidine kinase